MSEGLSITPELLAQLAALVNGSEGKVPEVEAQAVALVVDAINWKGDAAGRLGLEKVEAGDGITWGTLGILVGAALATPGVVSVEYGERWPKAEAQVKGSDRWALKVVSEDGKGKTNAKVFTDATKALVAFQVSR